GKSGEALPVIGLGTWQTFDVGETARERAPLVAVLRRFLDGGGRVIDSSPMYGSSEQTIGYGLTKLSDPKAIFSAEKVWTSSASEGRPQIEETLHRWGLKQFDLLQVHNLENWQAHLPMLFEMKRSGAVRYVGVTTSHGRRMDEVEQIMRTQPLDFVQFTYNIADRQPESRLLPLAHDKGIAVITNRPFREGALLDDLRGKPLPDWGKDLGGTSWPTFLLKFIVSHPYVNVAIPATSVPAHVEENMGVAYGPLPDETTRKKMAQYLTSL
ncbi:MAG TPA: aldo/keto reductase, partial [Gemmatimonadaceae bacterium]|nr:aldo/keto reductase [Gemmatimonadaceae bacterium]